MKTMTLHTAALVTCAALGASFFNGSELLLFFSYYGSWGTLGILLAFLSLTWLTDRIIRYAMTNQIRSLAEFVEAVLDPMLAPSYSMVLYGLIVAVCGSTISKQSQVLSSLTHVPGYMWAFILLLLILVVMRTSAIRLGQMAAVLAGIGALLFGSIFFFEAHLTFPSLTYQLHITWLWHAILYVALHLIFAVTMLLPVSATVEHPHQISLGIWIGGLFSASASGLVHLLILSFWHDVRESLQPMQAILEALFPDGSLLLVFLSLAQAVLTVTLLSQSMLLPMVEKFELAMLPVQLIYLLVSLVFAVLPIYAGMLSSFFYTVLTYMGLHLIVHVFYKRI